MRSKTPRDHTHVVITPKHVSMGTLTEVFPDSGSARTTTGRTKYVGQPSHRPPAIPSSSSPRCVRRIREHPFPNPVVAPAASLPPRQPPRKAAAPGGTPQNTRTKRAYAPSRERKATQQERETGRERRRTKNRSGTTTHPPNVHFQPRRVVRVQPQRQAARRAPPVGRRRRATTARCARRRAATRRRRRAPRRRPAPKARGHIPRRGRLESRRESSEGAGMTRRGVGKKERQRRGRRHETERGEGQHLQESHRRHQCERASATERRPSRVVENKHDDATKCMEKKQSTKALRAATCPRHTQCRRDARARRAARTARGTSRQALRAAPGRATNAP